MNPTDPREALLNIVEKQSLLGDRFSSVKRIGLFGGNGTFSLVFSAWDNVSQQQVALKVFHPERYIESYRWECFQREPEVLKQFCGMPDILQWVSSLDSFVLTSNLGLQTRFSFYATELATGDAEQAIVGRSWGWDEKLHRFRAMCRAVQRIHTANVVHRDIKPANFLTNGHLTMLSDFGTARPLFGVSPVLSQYAVPVGETTYSAPELFAGVQDIDSAVYFKSDLYALGATLFELLTCTPLNPQLYDLGLINDLVRTMNLIPRASRMQTYQGLLPTLETRYRLPLLKDFAPGLPVAILNPLERLYRGLCSIDYRHRLSDFNQIFSYLNQATILLRSAAADEQLQRRRALYKKNAERKKTRRLERIGATK